MNFMNEKFELNQNQVEEVQETLTDIKSDNSTSNEMIIKLQSDLDELHDRHIDLQMRSMRENLIFTGIPITGKDESSDETEKRLEEFMYINLKMDSVAEYERAHRFGKEYEVTDKHGRVKYISRPIVCRFRNFKERERVRKSAKELRGTDYGISEQFPKEINDRRKELWPLFQEARRQRKKAFFRRDRLFVEGVEVFPPVKDDIMETNTDQRRKQHEQQGARPKDNVQRRPRRDPRNPTE